MLYSPRTILVGAAVSFALTTLARAADTGSLGIGHVASTAQIAGWDIDVRADGQGLPPGHGSVREGDAFVAGGLQLGQSLPIRSAPNVASGPKSSKSGRRSER